MSDSKRGAADRAFDALQNSDRDAFATAFEDMVALCVDEYSGDEEEPEEMTEETAGLGALGLSAVG